MPIYTFRCPAGHQHDARVPVGTARRACVCGQPAQAQALYVVGVSGFARTPPSERSYEQPFRAFQEATAGMEDRHQRAEEQAGRSLQRPSLYRQAARAAKRLAAAGARDAGDVTPETLRQALKG